MVHDDDFDFEPQSLLQNRANMQNNVLTKRKEQLKDWEVSEVNKMTAARKPANQAKVKFQDSDIFLSACVSGDEEEVEDLLVNGANINVSTIDGVTALHQAVIDDNLDMVRFLVEHGADINAQDNEGWTPLHAAVCCSSLPIAKYLCEKGADLTLTNSDKELAVDLAESDAVRDYLDAQIRAKRVDVNDCREREFQLMMRDCAEWIRAGYYLDRPHPRTGATALHVAASKGYNQLIGMLIHAGADVNARDNEGWTPLHAAAHWAEKDACRILMENGASTDVETFSGQNVLMVADKAIVDYLTELQESFRELRKVALAQQQQKDHLQQQQQPTADEASRESSVSKSTSSSSSGSGSASSSGSSSSGSGMTASSAGKEPTANGYCAAASASFTLPAAKVGDTTTGTTMISSNAATKTELTIRGESSITSTTTTAAAKKLTNGTSDAEVDEVDEEEYTEEMETEYEDEEAAPDAEMEEDEEEGADEEEISAETATSSTSSKTTSSGRPYSHVADVLKSGRSASQPLISRETTAAGQLDRKYNVYNGKGGAARRPTAGDRQPSVASSTASSLSAGGGSMDDDGSEEMATGSQVSSIATTSRSVTPKDQPYGSDSNAECQLVVDSSNVSTRRHHQQQHNYLQKLPSAVDVHYHSQSSRGGWPSASERIVSEKPHSLSSSPSSAMADERRPFTAPSVVKRVEPTIASRFGSASSVSETTTSATTTVSSSAAAALLKRGNNAFGAEMTPQPITSRSAAGRVQLPPWIAESETTAKTNNNGSVLENRLMKPTIATSAKISAKVPPCAPPPAPVIVSMNPNPGPAMTSSVYEALPQLIARGPFGTGAPTSAGVGKPIAAATSGSGVSSQTPPTQPSSNRESERKAKSRLQRHSRRSTQGVTLEQVGEAARHISNSGASSGEESAVERTRRDDALTGQRRLADVHEKFDRQTEDHRLPPPTSSSSAHASSTSLVGRVESNAISFPKWRSHVTSASSMTADDTAADLGGSMTKPNAGIGGSGPTVSAYFKLPPHNYVSASSSSRSTSASNYTPIGSKSPTPGAMSSTTTSSSLTTASSATRANRRSQVVRGSRRGTGPVDMEAITAAAASSTSCKTSVAEDANSPTKTSTRLSIGKSKSDTDDETNGTSVQAESTYKLMYEKEQEANERLQQRVDDLTRQLARQSIPNGGVGTRGGTASQIDDQERRAFERRIAALEYELEKSKQLQSDYEKLKDENMALIRVLRKLSK